MWIWIHFNLLVVFILRNMSSLRVALRESLESHQQTQLDGLVRGGGDSGTSSGSSSSDSSSDDSHRQATTRVRRARVPAVRPARVPATVVPTQRCQNKILSCIDIHHKRYLDAEKSRALSAGRWGVAPQDLTAEVLKVVCDGRFVLIRCKKNAAKMIVLDLYTSSA